MSSEPTQEATRGHVNERMGMLEEEIDRAEKVQAEVQDRLQRLLYIPEVEKAPEEPDPAIDLSIAPLAHDIRRFVFRLRHVSDLHDKMLTELEI